MASASLGVFASRNINRRNKDFVQENLEKLDGRVDDLNSFKNASLIRELGPEDRFIPKNCNLCLADELINSDFRAFGIRNCLRLHYDERRRFFPCLTYYWRLGQDIEKYRLVSKNDVLNDPDLFRAILKTPEDEIKMEKAIKKEKERAKYFLENFMVHPVGAGLMRLIIRFTGWFLAKFFNFCFESINVHQGELKQLASLQRFDLPVIYVPVRKSFMDPFLINWVLHSWNYKGALYFASRESLKTPILGKLIKMTGGLGCRKNRPEYKKSALSCALATYLTQMILKGNHFMIPLETNRSRSGKTSSTIIGVEFYNILYQLHKDKILENATFVPISVSYERLPEENVLLEYKDGISPKLSFPRRVFRFFKSCWRGFGSARVNFGQPYTLRDVLKKVPEPKIKANDLEFRGVDGDDLTWEDDACSITSAYTEIQTFRIRKGAGTIVDSLAIHALYSAKQNAAIMCTNLSAFILLKRFPFGASLPQICKEYNEILRVISYHRIDLGFKGSPEEAILRSLQFLSPGLISSQKMNGIQNFSPILNKPSSRIQLNYYASPITNLFALDSILALALYKSLGENYRVNIGVPQKEITISEWQVIKDSLELCAFFKGEFLFHPPCIATEAAVLNSLRNFKDQSILMHIKKPVARGYESDFEDDYDDIFIDQDTGEKLTLSHDFEIQKRLANLAKLISPYVEIYSVLFKGLRVLLPNERAKGGFKLRSPMLRKILFEEAEAYVEKYKRGGELLVIDTVRNFINMALEWPILGQEIQDGKTFLYLNPDYKSETALRELSSTLDCYRII